MPRTTIDNMKIFTSYSLLEIYCTHFSKYYGERKYQDIVQKVDDSKKIQQYVAAKVASRKRPSSNEVLVLLNTIPYFIFSKAETLCAGSLAVITTWEGHTNRDFLMGSSMNSDLYVDCIVACSKQKLSMNTFFPEFFKVIEYTIQSYTTKSKPTSDFGGFEDENSFSLEDDIDDDFEEPADIVTPSTTQELLCSICNNYFSPSKYRMRYYVKKDDSMDIPIEADVCNKCKTNCSSQVYQLCMFCGDYTKKSEIEFADDLLLSCKNCAEQKRLKSISK